MDLNKLAFPFNDIGGNCDPGMTYRQWLAGLAMQALANAPASNQKVAIMSIELADALIAELERNKEVT